MVEPIFHYQFRLILIGDTTVGKSCLLRYFCDGKFAEISDPTVGVDFFARLMEVSDGTRIKLQLWDTAGQERFRSITKSYYRNSVGVVLVYDTTSRPSFDSIHLWMVEAKRHIEPHSATFLLVGSKSDCLEDRKVPEEEAARFARHHCMRHIETSSLRGSNVEEAFLMITQEIFDKIQDGTYSIAGNWDGIKPGYTHPNTVNFAEAEPAKLGCC